jgi:hypothetical protein
MFYMSSEIAKNWGRGSWDGPPKDHGMVGIAVGLGASRFLSMIRSSSRNRPGQMEGSEPRTQGACRRRVAVNLRRNGRL